MSEPAMTRRDEIPPWTLGWRLQRALAWAGMTTEQMADELGVARSTVSRWCNDKGRPTRGYLKLWAMRTKVPVTWLTDSEDLLPRVDSNHQSAGWLSETTPVTKAELLALRKAVPIRRRVTA